jgi:hypothetical protein
MRSMVRILAAPAAALLLAVMAACAAAPGVQGSAPYSPLDLDRPGAPTGGAGGGAM